MWHLCKRGWWGRFATKTDKNKFVNFFPCSLCLLLTGSLCTSSIFISQLKMFSDNFPNSCSTTAMHATVLTAVSETEVLPTA